MSHRVPGVPGVVTHRKMEETASWASTGLPSWKNWSGLRWKVYVMASELMVHSSTAWVMANRLMSWPIG